MEWRPSGPNDSSLFTSGLCSEIDFTNTASSGTASLLEKIKYSLRQKSPILQRTQTAGIHFSASGHLLTPFSSHSIMCWPCAVPGRCPSSDRLGKNYHKICLLLANDWKFCIHLLANKQENNNSFPLSLGALWGGLELGFFSLSRVTFHCEHKHHVPSICLTSWALLCVFSNLPQTILSLVNFIPQIPLYKTKCWWWWWMSPPRNGHQFTALMPW